MHELETYKLQIYIIFYYIYVLILVEKQKEQLKGRMEEPGKGVEVIEAGKGMGQGKDGGKEDSAATTITATSTPASGSPPPRCLSAPPSVHGEYREWVVDKVAVKAATEEERERECLAEWMPHGSQEMQEASVGDCGKLKCIFR